MADPNAQSDSAGAIPIIGQWIKYGSRIGHALFPGSSPEQAARSVGAAVARTGVIQSTIIQSSPATTYESGGIIYPKPPADWDGTLAQWQRVAVLGGNTTKAPPRSNTPPPKAPPPTSSPPVNPNAPATPPDPFGWYWLATTMWQNRDAWIKLVQSDPRRFPQPKKPKKPKKLKPSALDPRLMRQSVQPKPTAQLAELTVPKIFAVRMRVSSIPRPAPRSQAVELTVPSITAKRLPVPTPTRSSATLPAKSASLLSWLNSPALSLLSRSGYQTRARPVTNILSLADPLTRPQTGALTSPLGAFAGVPSTADCSCAKKPGKKGRRKRRTVCYEGSYRETATGTRKLRRQEVPCK